MAECGRYWKLHITYDGGASNLPVLCFDIWYLQDPIRILEFNILHTRLTYNVRCIVVCLQREGSFLCTFRQIILWNKFFFNFWRLLSQRLIKLRFEILKYVIKYLSFSLMIPFIQKIWIYNFSILEMSSNLLWMFCLMSC